jgi:DNA-binding ferritin-like protein
MFLTAVLFSGKAGMGSGMFGRIIEELKRKNVKIAERLIELEKEASNLKAENLAKASIIEERQRENAKIHDELRTSDRRVGELETRLQMQAPRTTGASEPVSL